MNSIVTSVFAAILFFILSPGVFLRIPKNGSKMTVTGVHALVFAVLFYFTHTMVYRFFNPSGRREGMKGKEGTGTGASVKATVKK
jgi:hypothetical protein